MSRRGRALPLAVAAAALVGLGGSVSESVTAAGVPTVPPSGAYASSPTPTASSGALGKPSIVAPVQVLVVSPAALPDAGTRPDSTPSAASNTPTPAASSPTPIIPVLAASPDPVSELEAGYRSLRRTLTGDTGIAVTPAGKGNARRSTVTLGTWQTGNAWSTSKVPISIAALRDADTPGKRGLIRSALTYSDNDATSQLRASLGENAGTARKITAVLRDYGDETAVPSGSAAINGYGYWRWSLTGSSRFAGSLANTREKEAAFVLTAMGDVAADQRWGLGKIKGASFKGGWSPDEGGYLERQFGIIRLADGRCWGVAIASLNSEGSIAGQRDLTRMAQWLKKNITKFPAGTCPPLP